MNLLLSLISQVLYEDLQSDAQGVIRDLFVNHLGLPGASALKYKEKVSSTTRLANGGAKEGNSTPSGGNDGWVKRTSDDLRLTLENFDELHAVLRHEVKSACLVQQFLNDVPGVAFAPCSIPAVWLENPPPPVLRNESAQLGT